MNSSTIGLYLRIWPVSEQVSFRLLMSSHLSSEYSFSYKSSSCFLALFFFWNLDVLAFLRKFKLYKLPIVSKLSVMEMSP